MDVSELWVQFWGLVELGADCQMQALTWFPSWLYNTGPRVELLTKSGDNRMESKLWSAFGVYEPSRGKIANVRLPKSVYYELWLESRAWVSSGTMEVLAFSPVGSIAEVKPHNRTNLKDCWSQSSDPVWVLRLLQLGTWSRDAPGSFWSILPRYSLDPLEQKTCTHGVFWSMGARDLDAQCSLIFRKWRSGCMVLSLRVFLKAVQI